MHVVCRLSAVASLTAARVVKEVDARLRIEAFAERWTLIEMREEGRRIDALWRSGRSASSFTA